MAMVINGNLVLLEPSHGQQNLTHTQLSLEPKVKEQDNRPFVERYRPETLSDLAGKDNLRALKAFVKTGKFPLAMVFYGDFGNGKTSAAKALIRDYYVQNGLFNANATFKDIRNGTNTTTEYHGIFPPVLYIDATLTRDIEYIRDTVQQFMKTVSPKGLKKFVIIDEADRLSHDAQGALRSLLEKYPNTITVYTTNSLHAIDKAIISRASGAVIEFEKPEDQETTEYLRQLADKEKVKIEAANLIEIARNSESLREAVGKLGTELTIIESEGDN